MGTIISRSRRTIALSISVLVVLVTFCPGLAAACEGLWVEPNEDVFTENEVLADTVDAEGPEEFKILSQTISEPEEGKNFKLEAGCGGKSLKPKGGEVLSCAFKVVGESHAEKEGREGYLVTEYEQVKAKHVEVYDTPLVMAKDDNSALLVLRPKQKGKVFPYNYGDMLAKGTTYPAQFELAAINMAAEFEITAVELSGNAAFKEVAAGTTCAVNTVVKSASPCFIEVSLTPNKNPPEEYQTNLKVKYKVKGEATVYEKTGKLKGENTT
jgi:hypothetical protein